MHQVLSSETVVRANSSREYREYVTKRSCVSLVLIIAFLTLISGYLLGGFISERKHRQMLVANGVSNDNQNSIELSSKDYASLKEVHAYYKIKEKLLASAQVLGKMLQQNENYLSTSLNTEIFNKYISCTQDIPPNTTIESSQFIEQLVDNTAARQRDCMRIIQVIIDNNLANG